MKTFWFLIQILFFLSCEPRNDFSVGKIDSIKDSVLFYYNISKDKKISLNERNQEINKSLFLLRNSERDTLYTKVLYQKNLIHFASKEYDSLLIYNNQLINLALQIKDNRILAEQYYLMGYYYAEVMDAYDKAIENYSLSKEYFQHLKDSSKIGRNLLNIGTIQKDRNDFFGSKETLTEAIQYLRPKKDLKYITYCYNALATDHRKLLNYPDAIRYYLLALKATESEKEKLSYKNNLAITYLDYKQYDKAISLLISISKDSLLINNEIEFARVQDNLTYAEWLSGEPIKEEAFQKPLKIRIQNKDQRGQIASYTHLGEFYSKKKPLKAKSYFDSVIQLSKIIKIPRAEKDALRSLMQIEPTNVKIRDRYVLLQDSLYEQELKVKTQFAKYKYDNKLKQESILHLEKERAEKELEVQRQRNQKVISYFGVGFLILLLGFMLYYFKQRAKHLKQQNKTAKLEATYETEAELSRRLHDDFGGKLNHVMLLLQNGADSSEVINVVDGLYNQSRDFSREINDVDTGPNFKDSLFGMLGNYCKNTKLIVTGSIETDWLTISELTKKTLYKVLQELIINMQKHSNASIVTIDFEQTKRTLKINYSDNGIGATKDYLNNRNGLWNTEKRIQAIEGTITFDSEKDDGFRVQIGIPN